MYYLSEEGEERGRPLRCKKYIYGALVIRYGGKRLHSMAFLYNVDLRIEVSLLEKFLSVWINYPVDLNQPC